jgi:probable phosphoglycerate mutase
MRLILIRHGQTTANVTHVIDTVAPGADLTEVGRDQARALAEALKGEPIEAIWTSNLVRTGQTAAPLAAALGVEPCATPDLREVMAGDLEGSDSVEYVQVIASWLRDPAQRMPGAENGFEFFTRFDGAIRRLAAAGHACAAVVSHGAALRVWLTEILGADLPADPRTLWFFNNVAFVVLDDSSGRWRVERWTDSCHHDGRVADLLAHFAADPTSRHPSDPATEPVATTIDQPES